MSSIDARGILQNVLTEYTKGFTYTHMMINTRTEDIVIFYERD